jgi:hypothetical protein
VATTRVDKAGPHLTASGCVGTVPDAGDACGKGGNEEELEAKAEEGGEEEAADKGPAPAPAARKGPTDAAGADAEEAMEVEIRREEAEGEGLLRMDEDCFVL